MAEVAELFLFHLDEFIESTMSSSSLLYEPSEPDPDPHPESDSEGIYEASFFFSPSESLPFDLDLTPQRTSSLDVIEGLEGLEGLRVIGLDSDSDSGSEDLEPFRWDPIRIELEETRDDPVFEWEEVDGILDEQDLLSMMARPIYEEEEEEEIGGEIEGEIEEQIDGEIHVDLETVRNIGWEVLLPEGLELDESVIDSANTSEYEILAGQIEGAIQRGSPPAAKCVINSLPSITLTEEDIKRDEVTCAVCKDDVAVKEKVTKLPCNHLYHKDCILPWLKMRNTCPVCRFELQTDDAEYENWKAFRVNGSGSDLITGLVESLDRYDLDWSV